METTEAECPVCLERMQPEDREGHAWLVCPNGCPTEFEPPERKPAATAEDAGTAEPTLRAGAGGS